MRTATRRCCMREPAGQSQGVFRVDHLHDAHTHRTKLSGWSELTFPTSWYGVQWVVLREDPHCRGHRDETCQYYGNSTTLLLFLEDSTAGMHAEIYR